MGVVLGAGRDVGASVTPGGTLGTTVGARAADAAVVGREALGVVASGCPQAVAAITNASVDSLAISRHVLIGTSRIVVPCDQYVLTLLYHTAAHFAKMI